MATDEEQPEVSREVPAPEGPREAEDAPARSGEVKRRSGLEALPLIFAPATRDEGGRVISIGAPGSGKTNGMRVIIEEAFRRRLVDIVITVDGKGRVAEFVGHERCQLGPPWTEKPPASLRSFAMGSGSSAYYTLADYPVPEGERHHVVLRGVLRFGELPDAEAAAKCVLHLCRENGLRVALNLNELDGVLTDGGKSWVAPSVRVVISQGRALRAWFFATTQQPQRIPNEPYDQATAIKIFMLEARAAVYMDKVLFLDKRLVALLPTLKRGEFVLRIPGVPWDETVYTDPDMPVSLTPRK